MKRDAWLLAFGLLMGLLAAGLLILVSGRPRGQPVTLAPPPTHAPLQVHVSGAVNKPGVYAMPSGSRVQGAIEAAGGLTNEADPSMLNLVAPLTDGQRLHIPSHADSTEQQSLSPVTGERSPVISPAKININTASLEELDTLPGIGEITAQKIIAYRLAHGPFPNIEAIMDVEGIGEGTFADIEQLISVSDFP